MLVTTTASGWSGSSEIAIARTSTSSGPGQWARIVLLSADRLKVAAVACQLGVGRPMVWRWQRRFAEEGGDGLLRDKSRPPGTQPLPAAVEQRVVELTMTVPPVNATHWSGRDMAEKVDISLSSVHRMWAAHGLQPHRIRTFKLSRDPVFVDKLHDIVDLSIGPAQACRRPLGR